MTLSPPQTTFRLASLADFFFAHVDFFPFSPNAEPGPRLRQNLYDTIVLWDTYQTTKQRRLFLPPSIQSWVVFCFLQVAQTAKRHCLEGVGRETFIFSLLEWVVSAKRGKGLWRQSAATHFVADSGFKAVKNRSRFESLSERGRRGKKFSFLTILTIVEAIIVGSNQSKLNTGLYIKSFLNFFPTAGTFF